MQVIRHDEGVGIDHGAARGTSTTPAEQDEARCGSCRGAGEIVINDIDNDGVMKGYDIALARSIHEVVSLPMTVLGGAGSLKDLAQLIRSFGIIGAAAGSLFVFKGVYRAVLINYPARAEKDALVEEALQTARSGGALWRAAIRKVM